MKRTQPLCNVNKCGDGTCKHRWAGEACPECDHELIEFTATGCIFCPGPPDDEAESECDYQRQQT